MQLRRIFLWSMIVSLTAAAFLGIAVLLLPRYGPEEEILGSTALFAAFSLLALLCAVVLEKRRAVALMWAGMSAAAAALVVWLVLVWFDRVIPWRTEENVARVAGTFTVLAVLAAQTGLLGLLRFDQPSGAGVRRATIGISIGLAVYIVALIWLLRAIDRYIDDDVLVRVLGVGAILTACGTVITPILWKVQAVRHGPVGESIPLKVRIDLTCPRCHTSQQLATGPARCSQCGLRITVDVEEPRCVCGYLLHRLESDHCPECGREVPERDRWAVLRV